MLDGSIDVAVGIVAQMSPNRRPAGIVESHFALCLGRIEQEGDHRVLGDVFGDVLFGVVGPHLLLVDVFFKDVAKDIGVDLVVIAQRTFIEVPLIAVEIGKDALESLVRDGDVWTALFNRMLLEQAAVQVWDAPQQLVQFRVSRLAAETFMEKSQQEVAVEGIEAVLTLFPLTLSQAVAQIVPFAVQEPLPLHEVDEHQAVQHEGGVPFLVRQIGDAVDETQEGFVLLGELFKEALSDAFDIEGCARPRCHVHECEAVLLGKRESDSFKLLQEPTISR